MTMQDVLTLLGIWAVSVIAPGPDVAMVLQRSLVGRRHGLYAALGVVTGITIWVAAAFSGIAALVQVHPGIMTILQVAGGLLLILLGVIGVRGFLRERRAARMRAGTPVPAATEAAGGVDATGARPAPDRGTGGDRADYLRGLATNLSNPKALVFFGAIITPFLARGIAVVTAVGVVAAMSAIALVWFCALAVTASHPRVLRRIDGALPWLDLGVAVLFLVLGAVFAIAALL